MTCTGEDGELIIETAKGGVQQQRCLARQTSSMQGSHASVLPFLSSQAHCLFHAFTVTLGEACADPTIFAARPRMARLPIGARKPRLY